MEHKKEIPTFDGSEFGTGKTKSKETMDKLRFHVLGKEAAEVEPPRQIAAEDVERALTNEIVNSVLEQQKKTNGPS